MAHVAVIAAVHRAAGHESLTDEAFDRSGMRGSHRDVPYEPMR